MNERYGAAGFFEICDRNYLITSASASDCSMQHIRSFSKYSFMHIVSATGISGRFVKVRVFGAK